MACDTCIKINKIPSCLDPDSTEFILDGITFPDYISQTIRGSIKNMATGRVDYFDVVIDNAGVPEIDLFDFFPFSNHPYQIRFMTTNGAEPANFVITNSDDTTVTGCCFEFETYQGLQGIDTWQINTLDCDVV